MATVKFLYRSTKDIGPITLRLLYRRLGVDYSYESKTRIVISKEEWKKLNTPKRIKDGKLKNQKLKLEKELNELEALVLSRFEEKTKADKQWLTSLIDDYYEPNSDNEIPNKVLDYFPFYLEVSKNQVSKTTLTRYRTAFNFFKKYINNGGYNPGIDEVDPNFYLSFKEIAYEQDYAINTVTKYFSVIKSLCKHAHMYHNLPISPKFDLIKLKTFKAPNVYLSLEELKVINALKDEELGERLTNVRDWLIISCFTGQRISDFMKFNPKHIRDESGHKVIDIIQQKGKKSVSIPLLKPVLKLMQKYNNGFPKPISDQKFNDYLKEVGKMAGLNQLSKGGVMRVNKDGQKRKEFGEFPKYELITSHIGRRSFATNFYGNLPTPLIMNITGHSKESTFLGYIGKTSKDTAVEAAKAFDRLNIKI